MLKSTKVESRKSIKCWWLTRPLVLRKGQRERKGTSSRMTSKLSLPWRSQKAGPKPETKCFYYKGNGHWRRKCPEYLVDKKDGKVNKGIFDIQVIDMCLTSVYSSPWVFDTCSVAKISNSKQELQNKQRLVEGEVTMSVGSSSKIDMIIIAHSIYFRD